MAAPHLHILIVLSLFLIITSHGISNTTTTTTTSSSSSAICRTYDCGNGLVFHYPFWQVPNSTAYQYCGYPGFGLTCSASGEPILTLPTDSYYVKQINYTESTLNLVDIDVVNQTCPRARHNLTLGTLPLDYSPSDLNLSFYFNCSSYPPLVPPIGCLRYGTRQSYVFTVGNETEDFDWFHSCEENVVVTVAETAEITSSYNGLISAFGAAMNKGFALDWEIAKDCGACEATDGFCGYNNTAQEFLCFCEDGASSNSLCKKGTLSFDGFGYGPYGRWVEAQITRIRTSSIQL